MLSSCCTKNSRSNGANSIAVNMLYNQNIIVRGTVILLRATQGDNLGL